MEVNFSYFMLSKVRCCVEKPNCKVRNYETQQRKRPSPKSQIPTQLFHNRSLSEINMNAEIQPSASINAGNIQSLPWCWYLPLKWLTACWDRTLYQSSLPKTWYTVIQNPHQYCCPCFGPRRWLFRTYTGLFSCVPRRKSKGLLLKEAALHRAFMPSRP